MGILEKLGLAGIWPKGRPARLIIAANRLPVTVENGKDGPSYAESSGGLATALTSVHKDLKSVWIGWPGLAQEKVGRHKEIIEATLAEKHSSAAVWLSREEIEGYYHGFSNKTIWPLFHYFPMLTTYDKQNWESYVAVNRKFCQVVVDNYKPGDIIWIHDYQLMLTPGMVRELIPDAAIGFFLHIPFPTYEVFRLLPWREEILKGILGADLAGFHTYEYTMYFLRSVHRILGFESQMLQVNLPSRTARADTFPIGIDYDKYSNAIDDPKVKSEMEGIRSGVQDKKIILSVDRLDYTKGIPQRLEAMDLFLERNPEWHGKVVNIVIAAPSRDKVDQYRRLKKEVDELVGKINGKYGRIGWNPIQYLYRAMPFTSMAALYNVADVALITPLRDGMNLVAKEFVAVKKDLNGVLVLSEMTGAATELSESLIVNPNDVEGLAKAIAQALTMPQEERAARMRAMRARVRRYNAAQWSEDFMARLALARSKQSETSARIPSSAERDLIFQKFNSAAQKLILLDYDGTLTRFFKKPEDAAPSEKIQRLLQQLVGMDQTTVVIISGRNGPTLEEWFGGLGVDIISEHGVSMKENGAWRNIEKVSNKWKEEIRPVMEYFSDRTPGSFIEEKEYSLVWHFRRTQPEFGASRANELRDMLKTLTSNLDLQAQEGNKVIDVRSSSVNKGRAARHFLDKKEWGFILAIGDDWTDEDMFKVLPEDAYSIKVGLAPTAARFNLETPEEVINFLNELAETPNAKQSPA
ncbi:MAG: bifunctional alpha,alpha-trehalose-phosphate synthase (UDP-forming)/trehalose-phosphatase [Nitrospinota bacterium]|nr:bifunctional alpha,alpha-trehalose-phosphate synthase (UDP-forming)/trehalose-phosphatase [Nitrospinota bacterium]